MEEEELFSHPGTPGLAQPWGSHLWKSVCKMKPQGLTGPEKQGMEVGTQLPQHGTLGPGQHWGGQP